MTNPSAVGRSDVTAAQDFRLEIRYLPLSELLPHPRNPRKHSPKQIRQIADSIRRFGFRVPVLIDSEKRITGGHGRVKAAKLLGRTEVPTICLDNLTADELRVFMITDNRLTENAEWDESLLAVELKELSELNLDFSLEITGFEMGQIDVLIEGLRVTTAGSDPADQFSVIEPTNPVTKPGDLWLLDEHRVLCGDARSEEHFKLLMRDEHAAMSFVDPPYNLPIEDNVSGKGSVKHKDFAMACGEMTQEEFTEFLSQAISLLSLHSRDGGLVFICMDWRHLQELFTAGLKHFSECKNLCVWAKDRASQGSLYRSQHELVFVFKNGTAPHINNIQLGQFGRYRSNVWQYPSAVSLARSKEEGNLLAMHPTVKPTAMVADAILDCSRRNDVILDSFLGSGTTIVAAEKTGRVCYGMEIDPRFVDVAIRRWEAFTHRKAIHAVSMRPFVEIEVEVNHVSL